METEHGRRYSRVAMLLHWLIAVAVIVQWRLAESAEHASDDAGRAIMGNHFSLGVTTLALVIARLLWRLVRPNPPLAAHLAGWERVLSKTTHSLFYIILIALPLAGWLAFSKMGKPVPVWGLFELPPLPVGSNPEGGKAIFGLHATVGTVLLGLVVLHILGTLKHTLLDRDGNLFRMLPFGSPRA